MSERKKGDRVDLTLVAGAGHFDLICASVLCVARRGGSNTIVVGVKGTLIFVNRPNAELNQWINGSILRRLFALLPPSEFLRGKLTSPTEHRDVGAMDLRDEHRSAYAVSLSHWVRAGVGYKLESHSRTPDLSYNQQHFSQCKKRNSRKKFLERLPD